MHGYNPGFHLDLDWINRSEINLPAIKCHASKLASRRNIRKEWQTAWLLKAVTCIDLTTLSGDDTFSNVQRLCYKAAHPIREDLLESLGMNNQAITAGAVCVYPARVKDAVKALKEIKVNIPVAAVATGFPSGQYNLETRLKEIEQAVCDGASEIDVVINRAYVLGGKWKELFLELQDMKNACGDASMKTILATGELGSLQNVYRASLVCMSAGANFIKTSTGKEAVNAILPVGIVMTRAIRDYFLKTSFMVGFKPAGGIRTVKDVLTWQILIKEELDNQWLNSLYFRIGASSLLGEIERQIYHSVTNSYAAIHELPLP